MLKKAEGGRAIILTNVMRTGAAAATTTTHTDLTLSFYARSLSPTFIPLSHSPFSLPPSSSPASSDSRHKNYDLCLLCPLPSLQPSLLPSLPPQNVAFSSTYDARILPK